LFQLFNAVSVAVACDACYLLCTGCCC